MEYFIEAVDNFSQDKMIDFLKQHENFTLFLLGNFENHGSKLTESPYSGNFKLIRSLDKIIGVFCLTRNGTLLIEAIVKEPIFDIILASCQEEVFPITGLVGNWDFCNSFWKFLKNQKIIFKENFISKEILYSVDLSKMSIPTQTNVRLLSESDYPLWKPLRLDYIKEEGFPNNLNDTQLKEFFLDKAKKKITWGFFLNDKLVSIADLNAKALDLGQVGGVYTAPNFRQKGYSKSVMCQLLLDAKELHSLRKLIIFTGEKNVAAQKLYISLGVKQIGNFALLFGSR